MKSYRTIFIWIGIFAILGIVLIMVACETGVLEPQNGPEQNAGVQDGLGGDTGIGTGTGIGSGNSSGGNLPGTGTSQPDASNEPKTLTVGKPYSVKLVEEGTKNVLILGQDKVSFLYDTMGIVSIDEKNETIKIIMLPRDTYIEYNDKIKAELDKAGKLHEAGYLKINNTHNVGSKINYSGRFDSGPISFLAEVIKEKFSIEIHDYVKINIDGFRELIDHLGGVDINVPYRMDYIDPAQDLVIDLQPGPQHLDGHDAEGFVRFRKGYREDGTFFEIGDSGRKKNQLYFMKELIKQKGSLKTIEKLPGIIEILGRNIQHSIGLGDMITSYMVIATEAITKNYEVVLENVNSDNFIWIDGSQYVDLN
jgi:LCP family protein required for cell wall assembly